MPHGAKITLDTLITQVLYIFGTIPYGPYLFLLFVAIIFFGAVVVGMDARARALTKVVRHLGEDKGVKLPSEYNLYQIVLLVFTGVIILAMIIADPMTVIRDIAALSVILPCHQRTAKPAIRPAARMASEQPTAVGPP